MKKIFFAIALAFGLNFVWEIAQSFLYAPHFDGLGKLISVHLLASFIDVVMIVFILSLGEIIFSHILKNVNEKMQLSGVILFGFILAVLIEKHALANSMWAYNAWMPILPYFNVGLTPVFQMILIPPIIWRFLKKELE